MTDHHGAGKLDRRLAIQSPTESDDAAGGVSISYATFATVWGQASYLYGSELSAAQKINTAVTVQFLIRYRSDVTTKMQISWDSKSWNIHVLLPDERRFFMTIMASQVK